MKHCRIYKNYPLKKLTTFKIGGKADFFSQPATIEEFKYCLSYAREHDQSLILLGGGSNVLISDSGIRGHVICTRKLSKVIVKEDTMIVQSGVDIKRVNRIALRHNLSGLEFTGGLPGSIGGAIYMNARVHGREMADVVKSVRVLTLDGNLIELDASQLGFSYKNSIFMKNPEYIIVDAILQLHTVKGREKRVKQAEYTGNYKDRVIKKQFKYPSAGCIFKNNYELNLVSGRLIDELGLKGTRIGNAEIFTKHANFIINTGHATACDVKKLIEYIEQVAYEKKGITLEREVRLIGF